MSEVEVNSKKAVLPEPRAVVVFEVAVASWVDYGGSESERVESFADAAWRWLRGHVEDEKDIDIGRVARVELAGADSVFFVKDEET